MTASNSNAASLAFIATMVQDNETAINTCAALHVLGLANEMPRMITYEVDKVIYDCAVSDYRRPVIVDGNKESSKHQTARLDALGVHVYGCEPGEMSGALKVAFGRVFPAALALHYNETTLAGVVAEKVPGGKGKKASHVLDGVPASILFDLQDKDGKPTKLATDAAATLTKQAKKKGEVIDLPEALRRVAAEKVTCDGTPDSTFGKKVTTSEAVAKLAAYARAQDLIAEPKKRGVKAKADADANAPLIAAMELVTKALREQVNQAEDAECAFAFTKDMDKMLFVIEQLTGEYFNLAS